MSRLTEESVRAEGGFTLAEMLVTMVIFSLALVVVTDGLKSGAAVWSMVESRMGQAEQLAMTEQSLSGMLDRAYPPGMIPHFAEVISETGTQDRFSFIHYSPPWPDEAGYVLIELQIHDGDEAKILELIRHRVVSDPQGESVRLSTRTSRLLEGASQLEFTYRARTPEEGAQAWQSDWNDPDNLPGLVRLTVGRGNDVVDITFEIAGAVAPECLERGAKFKCELW